MLLWPSLVDHDHIYVYCTLVPVIMGLLYVFLYRHFVNADDLNFYVRYQLRHNKTFLVHYFTLAGLLVNNCFKRHIDAKIVDIYTCDLVKQLRIDANAATVMSEIVGYKEVSQGGHNFDDEAWADYSRLARYIGFLESIENDFGLTISLQDNLYEEHRKLLKMQTLARRSFLKALSLSFEEAESGFVQELKYFKRFSALYGRHLSGFLLVGLLRTLLHAAPAPHHCQVEDLLSKLWVKKLGLSFTPERQELDLHYHNEFFKLLHQDRINIRQYYREHGGFTEDEFTQEEPQQETTSTEDDSSFMDERFRYAQRSAYNMALDFTASAAANVPSARYVNADGKFTHADQISYWAHDSQVTLPAQDENSGNEESAVREDKLNAHAVDAVEVNSQNVESCEVNGQSTPNKDTLAQVANEQDSILSQPSKLSANNSQQLDAHNLGAGATSVDSASEHLDNGAKQTKGLFESSTVALQANLTAPDDKVSTLDSKLVADNAMQEPQGLTQHVFTQKASDTSIKASAQNSVLQDPASVNLGKAQELYSVNFSQAQEQASSLSPNQASSLSQNQYSTKSNFEQSTEQQSTQDKSNEASLLEEMGKVGENELSQLQNVDNFAQENFAQANSKDQGVLTAVHTDVQAFNTKTTLSKKHAQAKSELETSKLNVQSSAIESIAPDYAQAEVMPQSTNNLAEDSQTSIDAGAKSLFDMVQKEQQSDLQKSNHEAAVVEQVELQSLFEATQKQNSQVLEANHEDQIEGTTTILTLDRSGCLTISSEEPDKHADIERMHQQQEQRYMHHIRRPPEFRDKTGAGDGSHYSYRDSYRHAYEEAFATFRQLHNSLNHTKAKGADQNVQKAEDEELLNGFIHNPVKRKTEEEKAASVGSWQANIAAEYLENAERRHIYLENMPYLATCDINKASGKLKRKHHSSFKHPKFSFKHATSAKDKAGLEQALESATNQASLEEPLAKATKEQALDMSKLNASAKSNMDQKSNKSHAKPSEDSQSHLQQDKVKHEANQVAIHSWQAENVDWMLEQKSSSHLDHVQKQGKGWQDSMDDSHVYTSEILQPPAEIDENEPEDAYAKARREILNIGRKTDILSTRDPISNALREKERGDYVEEPSYASEQELALNSQYLQSHLEHGDMGGVISMTASGYYVGGMVVKGHGFSAAKVQLSLEERRKQAYAVLELDENATIEQIKAQYTGLARCYNPEVIHDYEGMTEHQKFLLYNRLMSIRDAYEFLMEQHGELV